MPVKAVITDPATGTQNLLSTEGHLVITEFTCPPLLPQKNRIFYQYLTDDGTADGDEDMRVVGTLAAPIPFWIQASSDADRYITTLSFVIADDGANLSLFGAIAALANGCRLYYEHITQGQIEVHDALTTNWDFVRLCLAEPPFGTGKDAFLAKDVFGKVDAYIPMLDLRRIIPPFGVKLDRDTNQRLTLEVRDNTGAVDTFQCQAYGFDRFE